MSIDSLKHVPRSFIPGPQTQAYQVLCLLSDGQKHPYKDFLSLLGRDPRSPLQELRGPDLGFWMIHNVGSTEGVYQLDARHLSGDPLKDSEARQERERAYLTESKERAEKQAERLPEARERLQELRFREAQGELGLGYD